MSHPHDSKEVPKTKHGKPLRQLAKGSKQAKKPAEGVQMTLKNKEKFSVVAAHVKNMVSLLKRRKEITEAKAKFDRTYVSIDMKGSSTPYVDELSLIQRELDFARQSVRSALGTQIFRLKLWENVSLPSTAGGVCASTYTADPQNITEFVSAAALFDEYRLTGGIMRFVSMGTTVNNATSLMGLGVMSYDPTDNAALTVVTEGCQMAQHKIFAKAVQPTGTIAVTPSGEHEFRWHVPDGILQYGSASSMAGGSWQATLSTLTKLPYGYLKVYMDAITPSVTALSGIEEYHVEFRCRA